MPTFRKRIPTPQGALILDEDPYRYQKLISDIAGQDIHSHKGDPEEAIQRVRQWLAAASKRKPLPGGAEIVKRHRRFRNDLPQLCAEAKLQQQEVTFNDLAQLIATWLKTNR